MPVTRSYIYLFLNGAEGVLVIAFVGKAGRGGGGGGTAAAIACGLTDYIAGCPPLTLNPPPSLLFCVRIGWLLLLIDVA